MKLARSASAPRMLGCRGAGVPDFVVAGQLRPAAQDVHRVSQHGQDRLGAIFDQPGTQFGRHAVVDVAFLQQPERGHGIEQHGGRPQIGVELLGQLLGQERLVAQGGPEIEFGRGPDDAGRPKAVHQVEDLLSIGA